MLKVTELTTDPALPVVFWLSVGNVQFVSVPEEGVPSAPPGATKSVPAVAAVKAPVPFPFRTPVRVVAPVPPLATGSAVPESVTANVPEAVILAGVTDKNVGTVIPTEVTVPTVELVPAPIAVRKSEAFKAETVLFALKRGNVTASGLVRINILPPTVVAPSSVRAPEAVVAFVPPLAIGSVPETCVVRLTPESVPPRVSEPDVVTVPVSVRPLTVPVPPTEFTVPAPRLDRAVGASTAPVPPLVTARAVPDQLELLIDERTAREPRPRLVRASAAVEAPVPPSATARSVIPVIEPPVMVTAFEFCVAIVPRPRLVRAPEAVLEPVPPERTGRAVASVSDVRWVTVSTTLVPLL